ncbi:MAG: hypothetical protein H6719_08930 [Sandaracinaceae bacterium]|nr:hypothetical protein [Sandaracinaceae bacterium]
MSAALRIESLSTLARNDAELQPRYLGFLADLGDVSASHGVPELLDDAALLLELAVLGVHVHELAAELGCETWEQLDAHEGFADALAQRLPFDIEDVRQHLLDTSELSRVAAEAPRGRLFPEAAVVASASSITGSCPIEQLEKAAAELGTPERGHRCRVAYDALRAYLARHHDDRLRILGRVYAEGGMTVEEVARVMRIATEDAAALLQEHGLARPLEVARLDEEERAAIFAKMRVDRLARAGEPTSPDEEDARRDAIASSRIEDVDARPWLRRAR